MTEIPVYIMAVPWDVQRLKRANEIRKSINGTVVWDEQKNAMHTFQLLLARVEADGDQAFFLFEDDVQLADNWRQKAEAVVAERPKQIVQFFSMESEDTALTKGSREKKGGTFISNLCVYIPAGYASQLLSYSHQFIKDYPKFKTANDFVIRYWLQKRRESYWMHYPNLVQHEGWVSSINAKRPRWRKSHHFDGASS